MLIPKTISQQAPVKLLWELWTRRYSIKLQGLNLDKAATYEALLEASSIKGRINLRNKFPETIVKFKSELGGLKTRVLYQYAPQDVDLEEARTFAESTYRVYWKFLEIYAKPREQKKFTLSDFQYQSTIPLSTLGLPELETMTRELEPIFLECQAQFIYSRDWRTLGFWTTQLNLTNNLLLDDPHLSVMEKRFLMPYFTLIEEQVSLPWQRVCQAAAKYELHDPIFKVVKKLFPLADNIAQQVNTRLVRNLANMTTRRGKLNLTPVSHSCCRDLCMFQAYLLLCILEQSITPIAKELLTLCIMVLPSLKVKWAMIEESINLLSEEILTHLDSEEIKIVHTYLIQLKDIFVLARRFFEAETLSVVEKEKVLI